MLWLWKDLFHSLQSETAPLRDFTLEKNLTSVHTVTWDSNNQKLLFRSNSCSDHALSSALLRPHQTWPNNLLSNKSSLSYKSVLSSHIKIKWATWDFSITRSSLLHNRYCTLTWHLLYCTEWGTVHWRDIYCTVQSEVLYIDVTFTVLYRVRYCTLMWHLLYCTEWGTVHWCDIYCTVQSEVLYIDVTFTVLYRVRYCILTWHLLYCTEWGTVHWCDIYCTEWGTVHWCDIYCTVQSEVL